MTIPGPAATPAALQHIRGHLGPKVLAKSPELFNQSLPTVLAEVLQNARRAGATRVDAELFGPDGGATLVVRDDGTGIADMATLVAFGQSAWDERTDTVENAAGMGVFSLASRGVTVRSRGHRVSLTRAVFTGEAEAVVLPDPDAVHGTELLFPAPETDARLALERACHFYPLPVTLNGTPLPQRPFLDGAEHVAEWQGVRLGVFRSTPSDMQAVFGTEYGMQNRLFLNFHGHVVACPKQGVSLTEHGGPTWRVLVDVRAAPDLRLVLPARNEPIRNGYFEALRGRAERAIFECIARQPSHTLDFLDAQRAKQLGISLPPVRILMPHWCASSDELRDRCRSDKVEVGVGGAPVLVLDRGLDTFEEANLHQLLLTEPTLRVAEGRPGLAGYAAYDALPRVHGLAATLTSPDGTVQDLVWAQDTEEDTGTDDSQRVVAAITARLLARTGQAASTVAHEAAMPFVFTSDDDGDFPGLAVVAGTDTGMLARALTDGFFSASDDRDADSYDSQLERYAADVRDLARALLLTGPEAVAAGIVERLKEIAWTLRGLEEGTVEVRVSKGGQNTVRITAAGVDTIVPL